MTIRNLNDYDVLLFDCYGTLIDWESGILSALRAVFDSHKVKVDDKKILQTYAALEADAEKSGYKPYRAILAEVLEGIGKGFGFAPSEEEYSAFTASVKVWPPFDDSAAALMTLIRKYKLAVLSNIDDDLFAHSADLLGVEFDHIFTAQAIGSYKPNSCNFEYAITELEFPKERILHVAQSLFHDIEPAGRVGLATVWINRRKHKSGSGATPPAQARPDLEFPNLASFAAAVGAKTGDV